MVDFKAMAERAEQRREQEKMSSKHTEGNTTVTSGKQEEVKTIEPETAITIDAKSGEALAGAVAVVEPAKASHVEKFFAPSEMRELAGAGQENVTIKDTLLPRLAILQKLSPQLNKKKIEFIEGAAEGDWCDVSVGEVFKESIEVIPCYFSTQYIQWKKNRGGFAGNLGTSIDCLKETTLNEKRQNILPNGDSIAETAHWYVLIRAGYEWRRSFLPFSSTGLKVSRKWHSLIRAERLMDENGPYMPPLFYRSWTLKVMSDSNDQGDWFLPVPAKTDRDPEYITERSPEKFKTIYHAMEEMGDKKRWLLNECKTFYHDAKNNLVVGDMGSEDANDPANARVVNQQGSVDDKTTTL